MEGVGGGGGCIGSIGINSFFSSFFLFPFSPGQCTRIWLLLLAIFSYSYFIILYIWFLASLHFTWAEILGGNLSLCLV